MAPPSAWPVAVLVLAIGARVVPLAAPAPRYRPEQFECSAWIQRIRSDLRTEAARNERAQAGRDAVWSFRATAAGDSIGLEGWFDSLAVWREADGERLAPETDGLIGGRYQGRLGQFGGYRPLSGPFIPDEIALVADLSNAAADLFPLLPLSRWSWAPALRTRAAPPSPACRTASRHRVASNATG